MANAFKRFSLSIRSKLFLVSSTLIIIPFIGYQYIQEMEAYLRNGQEEALLDRARIIASMLHEKPHLFQTQNVDSTDISKQHLYVRPLRSPIQLDGYAEDWEPYRDRRQTYNQDHSIYHNPNSEQVTVSFQQQVGSFKGYLYALFQVHDDKIVYRRPGSLRLDKSDHLRITMQDHDGRLNKYLLATMAPGWVNAHRMPDDPNDRIPLEPEVRIKGEWQETAKGYNIEIRIPINMIGAKLAFAIADVDDAHQREIESIISTAGTRQSEQISTVTVPQPEVDDLLERLKQPLTRTWVIDNHYRVIALAGGLVADRLSPDGIELDESSGPEATPGAAAEYSLFAGILRLVYRFLLKQPVTEFKDDLSTASRLEGKEVETALQGQPATRWRQTPDHRVNILTAVYPVLSENNVVGAVAIEETSNSILLLQNRAMEIMINLSLLAFFVSAIVLLTYATRLSMRIRRLRNDADQAIGSDGRVKGMIKRSSSGDELGDLSRSFADMLARLSQYNRYLETMAGKLSHELRTPITVVRSSLDNLELLHLNDEADTFTRRARDGVERLSNLLTRMSEATRLEQTLQQEEQHVFDLEKVISGCVEGYRYANPDYEYRLIVDKAVPGQSVDVLGVPDLIAQLLDKLVSNARDFSDKEAPIQIKLESDAQNAVLSVLNAGPPLPEEMQNNLFDSMISVRAEGGEEPHLGLGLYIVRLIAEFHGGSVGATNRKDVQGAQFTVTLPLQSES
jgi:two-component system sensor histidine kinase ChvG